MLTLETYSNASKIKAFLMKIKVGTGNICGFISKKLLSHHSHTLCKQY